MQSHLEFAPTVPYLYLYRTVPRDLSMNLFRGLKNTKVGWYRHTKTCTVQQKHLSSNFHPLRTVRSVLRIIIPCSNYLILVPL